MALLKEEGGIGSMGALCCFAALYRTGVRRVEETGERRTRAGYYFPFESLGGMYLFSFVSYNVFGHAGEVPELVK